MGLTADEVYALAHTLGALLPWRTLGHPRVALRQAQRELLLDRLEAACYEAGLHAQDAVVIADALGSALLGGAGRFEPLAAEVARAKAVLHLAASGTGENEVQRIPIGTALQDEAIAQFLAWRLMVELPEDCTNAPPRLA
jgi:hypothetical protein